MATKKTKKKRIALFMLPPLTTGAGAEKYFMELAKNIAGEELEIDVITLNESSFNKLLRLMNIYYFLNFFNKIDVSSLFRENPENITKILGRAHWKRVSFGDLNHVLSQYDLIYTKNEISELLTLLWVGYSKLPPVIVGIHTPLSYKYADSFFSKVHNLIYGSGFYLYLLSKSSAVHVSNAYTESILCKRMNLPIRLIYYPFSVDLMKEKSQRFKAKLMFDKNKFNVAYIARLCEQKGSDILMSLIDTISKNPSIFQKISLNIFGSGEKYFEKVFEDYSSKFSWVRFYHHVENSLIPDILTHQNLLISPARWEVLPFNILEAQSLGVPVAATNIPGPSDIIVQNKTGYLADGTDDYIQLIMSMMSKKRTFDNSKIIRHIEKKFSPAKIYKELTELFIQYMR